MKNRKISNNNGAKNERRPKIGLALSGGAARGIAHIGVLKVLEEYKFPIDYIVGTSMGSIIAGAYAAGLSVGQLEELACTVRWRDVTKMTFSRMGLMSSEPLEQMLRRLMPVTDFAKMRIPLAVVVAELQTARTIVITEGDAARAIRISCTVPGIFTPVVEDGRMLVDGGLAQNLPVEIAFSMGADFVIGVDVNSNIELPSLPTNMFQVLMQSLMMIGRASTAYQAKRASVLVQPNAGRIRFDELERAADLLEAGETAMRNAMPQALELLEAKNESFWSRLRYGVMRPETVK